MLLYVPFSMPLEVWLGTMTVRSPFYVFDMAALLGFLDIAVLQK